MDSNNNVSLNNTNENSSLDIRDIVNFLFSKIWIIALVVLCFAIVAFLWTNFFIDPEYSSTTDMLVLSNTGASSSNQSGANQVENWSIGKQLTKTSNRIISGDYCDYVAKALNSYDPENIVTKEDAILMTVLNDKVLRNGVSFKDAFASTFGADGVTGSFIRSHISVNADDNTCIVSVTATTGSSMLSAAISNSVMGLFDKYINDFLEGEDGADTVNTLITSSGKAPLDPSNKNSTRNAVIFGVIGAILICAILVVVFIFDDKIKTPDDIEKQLKLSVLGAIPEIDEV